VLDQQSDSFSVGNEAEAGNPAETQHSFQAKGKRSGRLTLVGSKRGGRHSVRADKGAVERG
jgi:hypothetical protein